MRLALAPVILLVLVAVVSGGPVAPVPPQDAAGMPPAGAAGAPPGVDLEAELDAALAELGIGRERLGYRPEAWWASFPRARELPFLLPQFEALFAKPLALPAYVRGKAEAVRQYLPPLSAEERAKQPGDRLRKLLYWLAIDPRVSGFRPYSANLVAELDAEHPLLEALLAMERAGGRPTRLVSFGNEADFPRPRAALEREVARVPAALRAPMARLVLHALSARRWAALALRRVPAELRAKVHLIHHLGETQGDGNLFYPELEDAWDLLDLRSLCYAAVQAAEALELAEHELGTALAGVPAAEREAIDLRWEGPFGTVRLCGTAAHRHAYERPFLIVDLGGDDEWVGRVAANGPDQELSLALDLAGDDHYANGEPLVRSQGAGVLGVGMLLDGGGDDRYESDGAGQGMGQLGVGLLLDRAGDDHYTARDSAQGAGFIGLGLCLDGAGKDEYRLLAEGQGFGALGGVGVLADAGGDDLYYAEPDAAKAGRADYHSQHEVAANNVQGAGAGRRGDGSDGHSYAGGLGMLLDAAGDDTYRSGNWSLGIGYWFGTGLVWDGGGDDRYESCYFTQASGAHFAIGAIVDEAGNDVHELVGTAGAALGYGWDFVVGLLLDAAGDDVYAADRIALGCSQIRSNAFLLDLGGDDRYTLGRANGVGWCDRRPDYAEPRLLAPQNGLTDSVALLLDLGGGTDTYRRGKDGAQLDGRGDGRSKREVDAAARCFALFRDR
ncbi:MAG: hypothetical protein R3F30_09440 [Planctomycetota bacterium]